MIAFPVILSAPSGAGKTAIAKLLLQRRGDLGYSVSCTTRPARAGEVNGRDYYFISVEEFRARIERGEFAEWAEVHGRLYGTLRSEVERVLAGGRHVVMDIDVQGARQFTAAYPESVTVFVLPPTVEVLVARLTARKSEDPASFRRRLESARTELGCVNEYEYVVVNDELERAVAQVAAVIDAEAVRRIRHEELAPQVSALVAELGREIDRQNRS